MGGVSLSPLQRRVLRVLAIADPAAVLTGGAALLGFYTRHRTTRDLDLFHRDLSVLGDVVDRARGAIISDGLSCTVLERSPAFARLDVRDADDRVIVDLVADPTPAIEDPHIVDYEGAPLRVDSSHELLVNKLCSLLGRSEVRDLDDVRALLDAGGDLARALADAPRRDAGFSPLTLAWVLEQLPVATLARAEGWADERALALDGFRAGLVRSITARAIE